MPEIFSSPPIETIFSLIFSAIAFVLGMIDAMSRLLFGATPGPLDRWLRSIIDRVKEAGRVTPYIFLALFIAATVPVYEEFEFYGQLARSTCDPNTGDPKICAWANRASEPKLTEGHFHTLQFAVWFGLFFLLSLVAVAERGLAKERRGMIGPVASFFGIAGVLFAVAAAVQLGLQTFITDEEGTSPQTVAAVVDTRIPTPPRV